MKIQLFVLITLSIVIQTQTVSWRGVSDLGNGTVGITTSSQTINPQGSQMSSSSSIITNGSPSLQVEPKNTITVKTSDFITSEPLIDPAYTLRSMRQSSPKSLDLLGDWVLTSIGAQKTKIPSRLTSNSLNLDYCAPLSYSYRTQNSNTISFSGGSTTSRNSCDQSGPSFNQLKNAFTGASAYAHSGNNLDLLNTQGSIIATLTRPVAIASAGGVTSIASAPIIVPKTNPASTSRPNIVNTIPASTLLSGKYQVMSVNGYPIEFDVTIDNSQIRYKYCNTKNMKYNTKGSTLNIAVGISTQMACSNLYPTQSTIDNAFISSNSYSISGNSITFSNNGKTTVILYKN